MVGWNVVVPLSLRLVLKTCFIIGFCFYKAIELTVCLYTYKCVFNVNGMVNTKFSFIDKSVSYELLYTLTLLGMVVPYIDKWYLKWCDMGF